MYPEQAIVEWIDNDENIPKVSGNDASPIIPRVLRPDNLDFIIAKVT